MDPILYGSNIDWLYHKMLASFAPIYPYLGQNYLLVGLVSRAKNLYPLVDLQNLRESYILSLECN